MAIEANPAETVLDSSPGATPIGVVARPTAAVEPAPDVALALAPDRAIKLGRYVLLERIGAGAMGVVFAAYDPELDRKVAVKLLRGGERDRQHAERRLLREARALAKLAHPNVVAVHDAGTVRLEGRVPTGLGDWEALAIESSGPTPADDGSPDVIASNDLVFIAMEFVDGETLRSWLAGGPRSRADVLATFIQAGRGLAAAHAARIIHRDFKPDNVLISGSPSGVDHEHRVRVMDFGLARGGDEPGGPRGADAMGTPTPSSNASVTCAGAIAGTPVYMAPEQHLGTTVGPLADQFAFCVALWEALYGERPFAGKGLHELAEAVVCGRLRDPPTDRGVPTRLRRVLERGLASKAEARWPDMPALLDELAHDPARRWRMAGAAAACVAAVAGIAVLMRPAALDCGDREARLGAAWDDTARAAVAAAIAATGVSYAEDTRQRVEQGLDAYAERWMAQQLRSCEATDQLPTELLRTSQAICVADHKQALAALVEVLSHADAVMVPEAVSAVLDLPEVERCSDLDYLAARVKPPDDPETAAEVERQRERLARATALFDAGAYPAALVIADEVVAAARRLEYPALLAESLLRKGELEERLGSYESSETSLREAYVEAIAAGDEGTAADVAIKLIYVTGYRRSHHDVALEWGVHAQALVRQLGLGGEREAAVIDNVGIVYEQRADYPRALANHERALEIRERVLGPDHLEIVHSLLNLALMSETTDPERAVAYAQRALAIYEARLGPDHPRVAEAVHMLGRIRDQLGAYDEALALYRRALAIKTAAYGPEHPVVATTLNLLGNCLRSRGEYEEALAPLRRSLAIEEKVRGPDDPNVAMALSYLARVEKALHHDEEALALYRRALAINENKLGVDHLNVADALHHMGVIHLERGEVEEARQCHQRALAIREPKLGAGDNRLAASYEAIGDVERASGELDGALAHHLQALAIIEHNPRPRPAHHARTLQTLGETRLRRGELDDAIAVLERALALREAHHLPVEEVAESRFALARALTQADRELARARTLAEQAQEGYRVRSPDQLAEVTAWLAANVRP